MNQQMACRAEISLAALSHNLRVIQKRRPHADIVAMVKANAYGHDSVQVATQLAKDGVKWFGVATVGEGIELRKSGIIERILVMSGAGAQYAVPELIQYNLTPLVSSLSELAKMDGIPVHIDLDTGMTRGGFLGLKPEELAQVGKKVIIEGVSTHFAKAESQSCDFTAQQLEAFLRQLATIASSGHKPSVIHVDKSASILTHNWDKLDGYRLLARPGISLYGVDPTETQSFATELQPVLSWMAPIVLRKRIEAGTSVGYDRTFVADKPMEIALVRVGYADGLNRTLSGRGHFVIGDVRAPILGRISMDLTVVDVSEVCQTKGPAACEVGQTAYILGGGPNNRQTAASLARECGTIPYEILTWISQRVERVFV